MPAVHEFSGKDGFIGGKYTNRLEPQAFPAPCLHDERRATLTLFQPQITDWKDFTQHDALIPTTFWPLMQAMSHSVTGMAVSP
jgi:hypothetical protein